ncbi:MAG TPA: phosphatase PAP2 family protein [Dongiaceae bacterium]|nr:phosphatase PAP2 family protein [Dongiaceae bacterium]
MPFLKIYLDRLAICIAAAAFVALLSGISGAEENGSIPEKPAGEATAERLESLPAAPENIKTAASGSYYRIDANSYAYYEKPKAFGFLVNAPLDIADWLKDSFQKKNALTIAGLAVVTGGLIVVDQDLVRISRDVGHSLGISGDSVMGRVAPGSPIQYPIDFGTTLYYLGDGMIPISITVGMFSYGMATTDVRSLQTSSQLAEGLLSVAIVTQAIKRVTGRESPETATKSGGKWRFFPSFKAYGSNTPKYDAMPSGHFATGMMTITVLADNYPEYTLIKPIGYGLLTAAGFQMMNNGVHWASDYPLALAIGYGLGKVAVSHGRKVVSAGDVPEKSSKRSPVSDIVILPMPINNGGALFAVGKF